MSKQQQQPELLLVGGASAAANAASSPAPASQVIPPVVPPNPPSVVQSYDIPPEVDEIMLTILSWPRKHDSPAEKAFADWLRKYLSIDLKQTIKDHAEGAFSVTIPRDDGKASAVLFSCHIDTVDYMTDSQIGYAKKLMYDANFGHIMLDTDAPKKFGCLGADDGVGVWIMLGMIASGKAGTYLFHRGEEMGGVSSTAIAVADKEWLKTFDLAVAFDRPRDNEVITHQGGARCASDKAAQALCKAFLEHGIVYAPSDRGVYTDTKEYRGLIPECFNLGVGYTSQHTPREVLDYAFCNALALAAIALDWDTIPVDRTPEWTGYSYKGSYDWQDAWSRRHSRTGYESLFDEIDEREAESRGSTGNKSTPAKTPAPAPAGPKTTPTSVTSASLVAWIKTVGIAEIRNQVENWTDETVDIIVGLVRENLRLEAENEMLSNLVDQAIYDSEDTSPH